MRLNSILSDTTNKLLERIQLFVCFLLYAVNLWVEKCKIMVQIIELATQQKAHMSESALWKWVNEGTGG